MKKYFAELMKGATYRIAGYTFKKGENQEVAIDVYKALKANDSFKVSDSGEPAPLDEKKMNDNEKGKTSDFNYEEDGTPKDPEASDMEDEDEEYTMEELEELDLDELKSLADDLGVSYSKNISSETLAKRIFENQ